MKGFLGNRNRKKESAEDADKQFTWYGVNKTLFLRLALAAILFIAGVFLPVNEKLVNRIIFSGK